MDTAMQRATMIVYLEGALEFAERLREATTAYLIGRALAEARIKSVSTATVEDSRRFN